MTKRQKNKNKKQDNKASIDEVNNDLIYLFFFCFPDHLHFSRVPHFFKAPSTKRTLAWAIVYWLFQRISKSRAVFGSEKQNHLLVRTVFSSGWRSNLQFFSWLNQINAYQPEEIFEFSLWVFCCLEVQGVHLELHSNSSARKKFIDGMAAVWVGVGHVVICK